MAQASGGMLPHEKFDLRCTEMLFPSFGGIFSHYLQTTLSIFCNLLSGFEYRKVGIISYQTENYDMAIPSSNNFAMKASSQK